MISISDIAIDACRTLMEKQKPGASTHGGLRVKVEGGGCSGFQYNLSFDIWDDEDMVFWANKDTDEKFPVIVDKRSILYLAGSQINYNNGLNDSGFSVDNPKANSTCGCGESFSV